MKARIMKKHLLYLTLAAGAAVPFGAQAQLVISDTLTGSASSYNWKSLNGACLTAGGSTTVTSTNTIPACSGLPYYSGKTLVGGVSGRLPDPVGQGALRLTNGDTGSTGNGGNQTGAVVSNFTFPSSQGLQVTFSTVTYGGDNGNNTGADGITFFLLDGGTTASPKPAPPTAGGLGGSLGYSCSNINSTYDGIQNGYLGVGVDEYGNFTNGAVTTTTTTTSLSTTTTGTAYTGNIVTNSSGNPISPLTWFNTSSHATTTTLPTGSPVSPTTTQGSSSTSTAVVTSAVPNPNTTSTAGTSTSTTPITATTGSVQSYTPSGRGATTTYYKAGTYTTGTSTPTTTVTTSYSTSANDNTASAAGYLPGSISVRGAGNVNWANLSSSTNNPGYSGFYPSTLSASAQQAAVQTTCKTGFLYNASSATVNGVAPGQYGPAVADYPLMATSRLPSTLSISNQEAISSPTRGNAKPITYGLSITQNGLLNLSYSYNGGAAIPVITNQSITASNGTIPANFRFGFSAGTGGASNVHEITCFKAAQLNAASDSAGVNVQQSARVEAGTQVYLAYYHPTNWWGQLTATNLAYDASTDTVSMAALSNWDASCVLTGGACAATAGTNTAQATGTGAAGAGTRQLLTWGLNSSSVPSGVPLQWNNLSTTQQGALASSGLLGYLRGDRTNEIGSGTNTFRGRTGVLGDVIDSSPTWVGAPSLPYGGPWVDAAYPAATPPEGTSYATFASTNATRTNVVYAGANDGFMHAFRAGAYTASGTFDSTALNDGQELLGYMPSSVLTTIHNATATLDFSSPSYAHALFVDATPGTGDLYYNGAWHTWLVGGLGAGGNTSGPIGDKTTVATGGAIYALDITNPGNFSEANAASLVIGDWGPNSLSCFNNTPANCGNNLGNTFGTPIIRRLHDGNWAAIFGNGLNSSTGMAGIYIMSVSQPGVINFRFLSTGAGPSAAGAKNGIAYVSSADLDGDHITDYVYGGDALGNVWRFDLTSNVPATWKAGTTPLFSTPGGQPITTRVTVTAAGAGPTPRVMVDFATGQQLPQTVAGAATYASGSQSIYGIWDSNMSGWNTKGSTQYLTASSTTITASQLQAQTATDVAGSSGNISGFRTVTQNKICWKGSANCSGGASSNTQFGWTLALPDSGEQVIYNPTSAYGLFVVNTTIPAVSQALSCSNQPPSGYTMAIASDTGGAPNQSFFANATNNYVSANGAIVSGIGLSAVGTPSFVSAMTKPYMVNQTATGVGSITQVNAGANGLGARLNWIKLR